MNWAIEEKSYSQARACALIGLAPKTYRYQARRGSDEAVRERLRELAVSAGGLATGVCICCFAGKG